MLLPTLTLLLDDGSGTFPHNISAYALLDPGYSFNRGREDWQAGVTAGSLTLSLNNSDGRFTPGSTVLASPSPIRVDQQIRLKETVNGVTYIRFTGYVKSWAVSWPAGVDSFSVVQITATDAQARAERRVLRSVVEEEILADSPTAYYTLGEPTGATTAADSSGNQAPMLQMAGTGTDVVFGTATGPGTDGLTAATFAGGKYLNSSINFGAAPTAITVAGFFATTTATTQVLFRISDPNTSGVEQPSVGMSNTQRIRIADTGSDLFSGTGYNDALEHHVAAIFTASDATLYVDSVLVGTSASLGLPSLVANMLLEVGGTGVDYLAGSFTGVPSWNGSIAHVDVFSGALSGAQILAHYTAGATGFASESGTARLTRVAGYAGIPVGTLDTSLTNMTGLNETMVGTSAWGQVQAATDAEVGLSYIDGSGDLAFNNRNRAPAKTSPDITLAASFIDFGAVPTDDDQAITNYLDTTSNSTQVPQLVRDTLSEYGDGTATHPGHGRYSDSVSYDVLTDAEALDRANRIVAMKAEPTTRYGTLTVKLHKMTDAQASAAVAALAPGAWLQVTGLPSQNTGGTTIDLVVEGFSEAASSSSWTITCNVVARSLYAAWILDDTTNGVLDTTTRLYV